MSLLLEQELLSNHVKRKEVQQEIEKWLGGMEDDYTHAVTLTFPFDIKDELEAENYIAKFTKYLNKRCCRRVRCDADKVKIAIVFEGVNSNDRIHVHCAIRSPEKLTYKVFGSLIKYSWRKSVKNKQAKTDVKQYNNNGWLGYITKQFTTTKTNGISQYCNF